MHWLEGTFSFKHLDGMMVPNNLYIFIVIFD